MSAAEGSIIKVDMSAGGWAAVPLAAINNDSLSLAARGLLLWFLTRPPGWVIRVEHCKAKFALGDHAWVTITQQLQAAGYYHRAKHRDTLGRLTTQVTITPTPGYPAPDDPRPGESGAGSSGCRVTRGLKVNERQIKKEQQQPVVVFSQDLLERGLLSKEEQKQVHDAIAQGADSQELADELAGALRARGRVGERGIKNPVLFVLALERASSLTYAPAERALREARARVAERAKAPELQHQGAPMPTATRELMERLRRESRGVSK